MVLPLTLTVDEPPTFPLPLVRISEIVFPQSLLLFRFRNAFERLKILCTGGKEELA
jgi:hypothetical protein